MKKSFLLCACLVIMAFTLTACGEKNNPETTGTTMILMTMLISILWIRFPVTLRTMKSVITTRTLLIITPAAWDTTLSFMTPENLATLRLVTSM